jgi:hypothetical protein
MKNTQHQNLVRLERNPESRFFLQEFAGQEYSENEEALPN